MDNIEQYGRRQNLELKGIPQTEGEDTNEIVINLAKVLKADIKKAISQLHIEYLQKAAMHPKRKTRG